MKTTPRLILAAFAATLLSTAGLATAALAVPPSANQVSVPQSEGQGRHHNKLMQMFESQDEFIMFRKQIREATHGMAKDQKKAYRKGEIQKLRAMNASERGAYLHGLQAKWNALPESQRERMVQHMQNHGDHQHKHRHGGQNGDQGPQGDDQQMDQPR
jgi:hypothetical protein